MSEMAKGENMLAFERVAKMYEGVKNERTSEMLEEFQRLAVFYDAHLHLLAREITMLHARAEELGEQVVEADLADAESRLDSCIDDETAFRAALSSLEQAAYLAPALHRLGTTPINDFASSS